MKLPITNPAIAYNSKLSVETGIPLSIALGCGWKSIKI
jgi:hypothetical protein